MLMRSKIFLFITLVRSFGVVIGEIPLFRVLAPEFVCPNDEQALIQKPDNTIITIQTNHPHLLFLWTVRWTHLNAPTQRFTLLLWRAVRALERKLNGHQPEPFVYVIDNAELLKGVEYVFNITALGMESQENVTKTFLIDNIKGDQKLTIEGRSDKLSVLLLGADFTYTDLEYIVDAEVTTCTPTQDYYFKWSIQNSQELVNTSTPGSRLVLPQHSLRPGVPYAVSCTVHRNSHELVTQTSLPFQVLYRGLKVTTNFDELIVSVNNAFTIVALVENHDYYDKTSNFKWTCTYENEPCDRFYSVDGEILILPDGLSDVGQYNFEVIVTVRDQTENAYAVVKIVEPNLPTIHIEPLSRVVNQFTTVQLAANVTNVSPSCSLTWYFATEELLASFTSNDTCEDCYHGVALADSVIIYSLEENFLNELTDFTNATEWRQVSAEILASAGRARLVAHCGCSLTFNCDTQGTVHADISLKLNESPKVAEIKVSPDSGTALETVFRISTLKASDSNTPLLYTFYCSTALNDTLMLSSHWDYLAIETFLPYIVSTGTQVWVKVCDSLGACASSAKKTIILALGDTRTINDLLNSFRGNAVRCEMLPLLRTAGSAVSTYINGNQPEALAIFTKALLEILPAIEEQACPGQEYLKLLDWLTYAGIDISSLTQ